MEPNRDEELKYVTDVDAEDRPHKKSRLMGGLFLFLSAMMIVVIVSGQADKEGGKMRALVGLLASGGGWIGIGLILFPWTNRMVTRFKAENNFMIAVRQLPVLWQVWLVLAVVLTVGTWVTMTVTQK